MKLQMKLAIATIVVVIVVAFTQKSAPNNAIEAEVKELVMKSYVNGAFNKLDVEAMRNGFHKDFAIFSAKGNEIRKYPIADWLSNTEKKKADNYNPKAKENKWEPTFSIIDITGDAAQVKIELRNQGKHVFTDYLSLLKFDDGWKIVAKVYHRHK